MGAVHKAQLIVAVRMGDIAEARHLVECQGVDIHTRDHVCWAILHAIIILVQPSHPCMIDLSTE